MLAVQLTSTWCHYPERGSTLALHCCLNLKSSVYCSLILNFCPLCKTIISHSVGVHTVYDHNNTEKLKLFTVFWGMVG